MKKIIVFGSRNYAELAFFYLTYDSEYTVSGFTVDKAYIQNTEVFGLPVVPFENVEDHFPPSNHCMILPIGYQKLNQIRKAKFDESKKKGYQLINYISSKSTTWKDLKIGENCIISEFASIGPGVEIGDNVAIGPNVVIGHHSCVGSHCFISAGTVVLGGAIIEPYCLLGANATVKEGIIVKSETVVGSGVFISNSTKENGVYIGASPNLLNKPSNELRTWFDWKPKPLHKD